MIVRLKIKGFKNIRETELFLGAFTCIAGANGVGKSNLFDAIHFLSDLADETLIHAGTNIRTEKEKKRSGTDIQALFYHDGQKYADQMEFDIDMLVPKKGFDHLGQEAEATTTALNYKLKLGYRNGDLNTGLNSSKSTLEVLFEELRPLKKKDVRSTLKKIGAKNDWIDSVVTGFRQNSTSFIETNIEEERVLVRQDQSHGNKKTLNINTLPRTVISTANAVENPTMLLAKNELKSWKILQFEPSSLRSADDIELVENPQVDVSGGHLPSTLFRLNNNNINVKAQITNRLTELLEDIFEIDVDKDDKRNTLTLVAKNKAGLSLPARSLSDGTLRFLALSIMQADPQMLGIVCLEEPENGIHPNRIPPMIRLLEDIACDLTLPVDDDNPLRQVIINTHSPLVVQEVKEGSLLFAESLKVNNSKNVVFIGLRDTWRKEFTVNNFISKASLITYLNAGKKEEQDGTDIKLNSHNQERKIKERPEIQLSFQF